jgi:GTP cyclohydrolase FolE2
MFIEVSVSIQETERSYACVLGVSMFIEVSVSIQGTDMTSQFPGLIQTSMNIDTPNTQAYDLSVSWIDTDTSMNINTTNTQAYDLSVHKRQLLSGRLNL